jgi:hypothetical protein
MGFESLTSMKNFNMSNLRIIIIAVILFSLLGTGFISGESLKRKVYTQIEVDSKGDAKTESKVEVEDKDSVLAKLYREHNKEVEKDEAVKKQFLNEVAKRTMLMFGGRQREIKTQINTSPLPLTHGVVGQLTHRVVGQLKKLVRSTRIEERQKVVNELPFRKFQDDDESLLAYLESVLDSRLFETAFLGSVEGTQILESTEETEFKLPPKAIIKNKEELENLKWKVDFGEGNIMKAQLKVDAEKRLITLVEKIVVTEDRPTNLLSEDNSSLIKKLKEYGSFVIQYETYDSSYQVESVPDSAPFLKAKVHSYSKNLGVAEIKLEPEFEYPDEDETKQVTVKIAPTIKLSFDLGAELKWEWEWKGLKCKLKYFETTLTLKPAVGAYISISSDCAISKKWEREKPLFQKSKEFRFAVGIIPVVIVLEADLRLNVSCDLKGAIKISTGGGLELNSGVTFKYQNRWSANPNFELKPYFDEFNASAGIEAKARAEFPFTVSAYLYNVAGPFAQLNPYIEVSSKAEATTTTGGIHYEINGGFEVNGGVQVAGWLKKLLKNGGQHIEQLYSPKPLKILEGDVPITIVRPICHAQLIDNSCGSSPFVSGDYVYFQGGPNRNALYRRKIRKKEGDRPGKKKVKGK